MKPAKKAYEINTRDLDRDNDSIRCGYLEPVFADNEKEARKQALSIADHHDLKTYLGDELTYITIKVKRSPELDLFSYGNNGELKSKSDIERIKKSDEHFEMIRQMLVDDPNGWAYIRKGGSYYRPSHCGYTEYKTEAGVYSMKAAVSECLSCSYSDYMRPEPINVQAHNLMINEKIEALKAKLIS